jgi:transcriptional regulator with PAS, ATPase and Fis domain
MSKSLKTGYETLREEIAERRQSEQEREKSEKFLNTIFDSIYDPFCIIDRDFNIVRANDSYARLKNKTAEELIGRRCFEATANRTSVCEGCVVEKTFRSSHPSATDNFTCFPRQKAWLKSIPIRFLTMRELYPMLFTIRGT